MYRVSVGTQYGRYAAVLVLVYLIFYGSLIVAANGLPYVLDANESFSSLWHAINLHHFGLRSSFGLTDEAYGFDPAAHPYIYTHQGNFPRLFAYVIYLLGARSIESQIVVTTFTVGLLSTVFAYAFFTRLVNPLFGLLACLVLITDYILVAQWQVVTYRVWYGFFVFSSALCVHACADKLRFWRLATIVNFACLFYFEFVFVLFLSIATLVYAVLTLRNRRATVAFIAAQAAGAAIGLGVLFVQLVAFLGWNDVLRDAYLTFVARNRFLSDPALLKEMKEFFDSRNIVFWYNLEDGSRFRTFGYFVASITFYELQIHTPLFTAFVAIVLLGLVIGLLHPPRSESHFYRRTINWCYVNGVQFIVVATVICLTWFGFRAYHASFQNLHAATLAVQFCTLLVWLYHLRRATHSRYRLSAAAATVLLVLLLPSLGRHSSTGLILLGGYSNYSLLYFTAYFAALAWSVLGATSVSRVDGLGAYILIVLPVIVLVVAVQNGDWVFGVDTPVERVSPTGLLLSAIGVLAFTFGAWSRERNRIPLLKAKRPEYQQLVSRAPAVALYLSLVSLFVWFSWRLYHPAYHPLWEDLLAFGLPGVLKYVALYLAVGAGGAFASVGTWKLLTSAELRGLGRVAMFLLAGLLAYCIIYAISPGYIFTGYRFRVAPFTVFHTNVTIAIAVFVVVAITFRLPALIARTTPSTDGEQTLKNKALARILTITSASLLVLLVWCWAAMQFRYFKLLPPNNYHFLKILSKAPYVGKSFLVNTYAAPIAAATGQWAYLHEGLTVEKLPIKDGKLTVELDDTYLWFADKASNSAYERPDYFICIVPQTIDSASLMARQKLEGRAGPRSCMDHLLVRLATSRHPMDVSPQLQLVAYDAAGKSEVGFERWAIVRFLWEDERRSPQPGKPPK